MKVVIENSTNFASSFFNLLISNNDQRIVVLKHLLFLNDLSSLCKKSVLSIYKLILSHYQILCSSPMSPINSLDETRCHRNFLKAPFNSKHAPVFLNVNCSQSFFFTLFLCLTVDKFRFDLINTYLSITQYFSMSYLCRSCFLRSYSAICLFKLY